MGFSLKELLNLNNKQKQAKPQPASTAQPSQPQNNGWSLGRVAHDITHNPVTNFAGAPVDQLAAPVVNKVKNLPVIKPLLQNDSALVQGAKQVASLPVNDIKYEVAKATHNPVAAQNAGQQVRQGVGQVTGAAQSIPRSFAQAYQTVIDKPSATATTPFEKVLYGNQPVTSLQKQYQQARQSGESPINAATGVAVSGIQDIGQLGGAFEGAKSLAHVTTNLVDKTALSPLGEAGSIQISNPDNAKVGGLEINNPMGASTKPLQISNPLGAETGQRLNIKNNTGAPLIGEDLSGAAQQSFLSKAKARLTPLDQSGSVQIPGGKKQNLARSSSDSSIASPKIGDESVYRSENPNRYGVGQAELGSGLYTGSKEIAGRMQNGEVITDGLHQYRVNPGAKILDSSSDIFKSIDSKASNSPALQGLDGRQWQQTKANIITQLVKDQGFDGVRRGTNQVVAMSDKALIPSTKNAPTYKPDQLPIIGPKLGKSANLQSEAQPIRPNPSEIASGGPLSQALPLKQAEQTPKLTTQLVKNVQNVPSGKSTINSSRLQAQTAMHDILNQGGTVDEAINDYMSKTKGTFGEAQLALQKLFNDGTSLEKGNVNAKLNPKFNDVPIAKVAAGDANQAILNARSIQNKVKSYGSHAVNLIGGLSPADHSLMDSLRTTDVTTLAKQAENPKAFTEAANAVKDYNDFTHAAGSGLLGQNVPYRKNYGAPLLLDQSTPEAVQALEAAKAQLKTRPGYGKHRSFNDYNDAAQFGLKRLNNNFSEDLQHDISHRSNDLNQLALAKGLNDAFPNQVKIGEIGSTPEGTYKQLQISGGNKLSLPADIADQLNSRAYTPTKNRGLQAYDKTNAALKYTKLGLGGFHGFTEAGNFIGQQLASGKVLTDPKASAGLFKSLFSDNFMKSENTRLASNGTLDKASLSGLMTKPEEILADVNVGLKGKISKYTGIKAMHDAVFNREIPYAKLKNFEQKTQGLSIDNPTDVATMRSIAKEINQNYGGINRAVEGLRPKEFQVLQRALLATDFTEGKIHTLFDAISKGGEAGKQARQVVAGKVLLFGGLAAAGGALGGEYQGKDAKQVVKDVAGKLADPSFEFNGYKVKTPQTHVSELVNAVKPYSQNSGAPWNASGILHYATSRTAALPSEVTQLAANKDYYGQPIYGKDTKKNGGGTISPFEAALNAANTVSPIAVGQGITAAQGKQNLPAAAANIIGFNARPNPENQVKLDGVDTTLTDQQRKQYEGQLNPTIKSWTDKLKASDAYKNASPNDQANAETQLKKDVTTATARDFSAKNSLGQYASDYSGEQNKLSAKQQNIVDSSLDVADYLKTNGQTTVTKTKGDKATQVFNNTNSDYDLSLSESKTSGDINTWLDTAQKKYDTIEKYKKTLDPNTDHVKINSLTKQQDSIKNDATKFASYAGFTKPKATKASSANSNAKGFGAKQFNGTANLTALRSLVRKSSYKRKAVKV